MANDNTAPDDIDVHKGLIAWFARNKVAANLLMMSIIVLGLAAAFALNKQMFPNFEINWINVSVVYFGAAPEEVEESVTSKLEDALEGVTGIKRFFTRSSAGLASASIEVSTDYDTQEVLDKVRSAIDSISSFPGDIERPQVKLVEYRQEVMYVMLSADTPRTALKRYGQTIYDEITALPGVDISDYYSGMGFELGIEVSKNKLREYDLSFDQVRRAVQLDSANTSAGQLRADNGIVSLRIENQAYTKREYEELVVRTQADGSVIRLKDVAVIRDGFEEGLSYGRVNGKNVVLMFIGATAGQDISTIANTVREYVSEKNAKLAPGLELEVWADLTYYLNGRLEMMLNNMLFGGLLVFLLLTLFLRPRLAFWVMMGLPVSFLGALMMLQLDAIDITINVVSLFAFIMVLGVVVDDAIIIGESIHSETEKRGYHIDDVIRGAKRVATPATFGVLTTIAAFMPLVLQDGPQAAFPNAIGTVVVLCLIFSLIESKLILPAHLVGMKPVNPNSRLRAFNAVTRRIDRTLKSFVDNYYGPRLARALHYRYAALAVFIGFIIIAIALFAGKYIRFNAMPKVPHDFPSIRVDMNANTSDLNIRYAIDSLEAMIASVEEKTKEETGQTMVAHVLTDLRGRSSIAIDVKLVDPEERPYDTFELARRWNENMPNIPAVKQLRVQSDLMGGGGENDGDVSFRLNSRDAQQLNIAAEKLREKLRAMPGVTDVNDSQPDASTEVFFDLKPAARALGLTLGELARQANTALYGSEIQRIVRDRQEIRVMLRYPRSDRNSLDSLNNVMIDVPSGARVPLGELATVRREQNVRTIYREDGERSVIVFADLDFDKTQPLTIADDLRDNFFPELERNYPSVRWEESGSLAEERSNLRSQIMQILVILIPIYLLLAIPLKSYTQPFIIMSIIPFGIIGAIFGHVLLGLNLSSMSLFGIFAAIGVVVNDSLVLVDSVNQIRANNPNKPLNQVVIEAGQGRFRPIILTSLTTFFGLLPIIAETSLQAKIVIPMAVSLAFGVLFATVVTLVLIPSLYIIHDDIKKLIKRKKTNSDSMPAFKSA